MDDLTGIPEPRCDDDEEWRSYRLSTRAGRHFGDLRADVEAELPMDVSEITNTAYCPPLLNHLCAVIMPLAPLWMNLKRGSVSNACVESWFRTLKNSLI